MASDYSLTSISVQIQRSERDTLLLLQKFGSSVIALTDLVAS